MLQLLSVTYNFLEHLRCGIYLVCLAEIFNRAPQTNSESDLMTEHLERLVTIITLQNPRKLAVIFLDYGVIVDRGTLFTKLKSIT